MGFFSSFGSAMRGLSDTLFGTNYIDKDTLFYQAQLHDNLADRQMQRDIDFWRMQADYDSPSAQMQRARDAGLNPSLLYGQPIAEAGGSSLSSAPHPGATSGAGNLSLSQLLTSIGGVSTIPEQKDLLRAQAEELRSRVPLNQQRVNESRAKVQDLFASVAQRMSSAAYQDALRKNISFEQLYKMAGLDLESQRLELDKNKFLLDYQRFGLEKMKTEAEIKKIDAETRSLLARAKVTERELQEMIDTYAIRKTGLIKQNSELDARIRQADATADKLRKEGVRFQQLVDIDSVKADQQRTIMSDLESDNVLENIGGLILYGIEYTTNTILGKISL